MEMKLRQLLLTVCLLICLEGEKVNKPEGDSNKSMAKIEKNTENIGEVGGYSGQESRVVATSTVKAEAEQGDGPAAASASSSAVGIESTKTSSVSTVIGPNSAAAACDFAVVAVGPNGASAASEIGVVSVGPKSAAASSNAANANKVAVEGRDKESYDSS